MNWPDFRRALLGIIAASLAFALGACHGTDAGRKSSMDASADVFVRVKPIFEHRCLACHGDAKPTASLNFQDRGTVFGPGTARGKFITPGHADKSLIYLAVTRPNLHPRVMPGDGFGLNRQERADLRLWIESGAAWPSGRAGRLHQRPLLVKRDDHL